MQFGARCAQEHTKNDVGFIDLLKDVISAIQARSECETAVKTQVRNLFVGTCCRVFVMSLSLRKGVTMSILKIRGERVGAIATLNANEIFKR